MPKTADISRAEYDKWIAKPLRAEFGGNLRERIRQRLQRVSA